MSRTKPIAVLLDMDGVLYHGDHALADAAAFLEWLRPIPHAYITNNPIRTPAEVAAHFVAIGLPAPDTDRIVTSAQACADWLQRQEPGFRYFAVGAGGLDAALREVGTADSERAGFVVVGEGSGLDFEQLSIGVNLILQRGARLVVTNPDTSVDAWRDGAHWVLPGGGALVAPFAVATGQRPLVIGKPEPLLYQMAIQRLGIPARQCLMVGDRPDTDIAGATALGLWTALVRSGRFAPGQPWSHGQTPPDWDCPDLSSLMVALTRAFPETFGAGISDRVTP